MKYWRPPSMRRAASSSSVRIIPSRGPEFVADQVLPAVAAGERQVCRLDVAALGEVGDELGVFVVGVGPDHQHARRGAEPFDGFPQRGGAAVLGNEGSRRDE